MYVNLDKGSKINPYKYTFIENENNIQGVGVSQFIEGNCNKLTVYQLVGTTSAK
jgi:hypothetical protein